MISARVGPAVTLDRTGPELLVRQGWVTRIETDGSRLAGEGERVEAGSRRSSVSGSHSRWDGMQDPVRPVDERRKESMCVRVLYVDGREKLLLYTFGGLVTDILE